MKGMNINKIVEIIQRRLDMSNIKLIVLTSFDKLKVKYYYKTRNLFN